MNRANGIIREPAASAVAAQARSQRTFRTRAAHTLTLGAAALALMLLQLSGLTTAAAVQAQRTAALEKIDGFTYGPMLGNVTNHSVRIWARTLKPDSFKVLYSTSADLAGAISSPAIRTTWEHDAAGWSS